MKMQQEFLEILVAFVRHINRCVVLDQRDRVRIMVRGNIIDVPDTDDAPPVRVQDFKGLSKYVKLIQGEGDHIRVYGFIDEFGNLWKAATWNSPAKNQPRGNLHDRESYRASLTPYGFAYLN